MKNTSKNTTRYVLLGVVVVLIVAAIIYLQSLRPQQAPAGNLDNNISILSNNPSGSPDLGNTANENYPKAPELAGIAGWINTKPLTLQSLHGKVVLIDFWAYSCVNCLRTLPYLNSWNAKYKDSGLVIIGIHTPEFNFEKDYNNVLMATKKYSITYPVAQDNDYMTWTAFQNQYWPREYLIDKNGYIRYDHIGEGNYDETEAHIQQLLSELGNNMTSQGLVNITDQTPTTYNTQELYVGYNFAHPRGQNVGNPEGLIIYKTINYTMPKNSADSAVDLSSIKQDTIYVEGPWTSDPDNLATATNDASSIYLSFIAENANIVASSNISTQVEVLIDGKDIDSDVAGSDVIVSGGKSFMKVDEPRLYDIYRGPYGRHVLQLVIMQQGFSFNSFTFG